MKKNYIAPVVIVVEMDTETFLASSPKIPVIDNGDDDFDFEEGDSYSISFSDVWDDDEEDDW